jgi:hypothetical protein
VTHDDGLVDALADDVLRLGPEPATTRAGAA